MSGTVSLARWLLTVEHVSVNYPGGVGGECVDLCNDYLQRAHGHGAVRRNAADWRMARLDPREWAWEANGPTNFPPVGAIVVWGGPSVAAGTGINGHVAVALLADVDLVWSVDQNWGGRRTAETNWHIYAAVIGWWRLLS